MANDINQNFPGNYNTMDKKLYILWKVVMLWDGFAKLKPSGWLNVNWFEKGGKDWKGICPLGKDPAWLGKGWLRSAWGCNRHARGRSFLLI